MSSSIVNYEQVQLSQGWSCPHAMYEDADDLSTIPVGRLDADFLHLFSHGGQSWEQPCSLYGQRCPNIMLLTSLSKDCIININIGNLFRTDFNKAIQQLFNDLIKSQTHALLKDRNIASARSKCVIQITAIIQKQDSCKCKLCCVWYSHCGVA